MADDLVTQSLKTPGWNKMTEHEKFLRTAQLEGGQFEQAAIHPNQTPWWAGGGSTVNRILSDVKNVTNPIGEAAATIAAPGIGNVLLNAAQNVGEANRQVISGEKTAGSAYGQAALNFGLNTPLDYFGGKWGGKLLEQPFLKGLEKLGVKDAIEGIEKVAGKKIGQDLTGQAVKTAAEHVGSTIATSTKGDLEKAGAAALGKETEKEAAGKLAKFAAKHPARSWGDLIKKSAQHLNIVRRLRTPRAAFGLLTEAGLAAATGFGVAKAMHTHVSNQAWYDATGNIDPKKENDFVQAIQDAVPGADAGGIRAMIKQARAIARLDPSGKTTVASIIQQDVTQEIQNYQQQQQMQRSIMTSQALGAAFMDPFINNMKQSARQMAATLGPLEKNLPPALRNLENIYEQELQTNVDIYGNQMKAAESALPYEAFTKLKQAKTSPTTGAGAAAVNQLLQGAVPGA